MGENFKQMDSLPSWHKESQVTVFKDKVDTLHALQKKNPLFPNELPINDAAIDFLREHPDAKSFYAFHMLIGSTVSPEMMDAIRSFDYPDGAIQELVDDLMGKLNVVNDDKIST